MRNLCLLLLIMFAPLSLADSAENYRDDFLKTCHDNSGDAEGLAMCQCIYTGWLEQLPSKTEASVITAAKLLANVEGDYKPSEINSASVHLGSMQNISLQCADTIMGSVHLGGDQGDISSVDDAANIDAPATTKSKRGLLGAVVGWAGEKAGLPDAVNEAAADTADDNEDTIRNKLNPLKSRFNPFKKD